METYKRNQRGDEFWIVVDEKGVVQARLEAIGRMAAERIAWTILPECETGGLVIGWRQASVPQRIAARQALKIDRRLCLKYGIDRADLAAWQLRGKFAHTTAGGGR